MRRPAPRWQEEIEIPRHTGGGRQQTAKQDENTQNQCGRNGRSVNMASGEQTDHAQACAGRAIVVQPLMKRPVCSEKTESKDEHSQQTSERRSGGAGKAKQFSFQMHAVRQ